MLSWALAKAASLRERAAAEAVGSAAAARGRLRVRERCRRNTGAAAIGIDGVAIHALDTLIAGVTAAVSSVNRELTRRSIVGVIADAAAAMLLAEDGGVSAADALHCSE